MELGWIHINRDDRNRVFEALKSLEEQDATDELGIGKIRDYFSNQLFPGITTNQTRAKYFIFSTNLIEDVLYYQNINSLETLKEELEKAQKNLVASLFDASEGKIIGQGILDSRNYIQGKEIKQKPLSVYLSGLFQFGIIKNDSQAVIQRTEDLYERIFRFIKQNKAYSDYQKANKASSKQMKDYERPISPPARDFFPKTNCYQENWDVKPKMDLTQQEANFLFNQITKSCNGSLLALILNYYNKHKKSIEPKDKVLFEFETIEAKSFDSYIRDLDGIWRPENSELQKTYKLASQFRFFYRGCQLMYAYLLSGKQDKDFLKEFKKWLSKKQDWSKIDLEDICKRAKVAKTDTEKFLNNALTHAKNSDISEFGKLIKERELKLKKERAKIGKDNQQKGFTLLDFHAINANRIIQDILKGLINNQD